MLRRWTDLARALRKSILPALAAFFLSDVTQALAQAAEPGTQVIMSGMDNTGWRVSVAYEWDVWTFSRLCGLSKG